MRRRFEAIMGMIHDLEQEEASTGLAIPLEQIMKRLVHGTMGLNRSSMAIERGLDAEDVEDAFDGARRIAQEDEKAGR